MYSLNSNQKINASAAKNVQQAKSQKKTRWDAKMLGLFAHAQKSTMQ